VDLIDLAALQQLEVKYHAMLPFLFFVRFASDPLPERPNRRGAVFSYGVLFVTFLRKSYLTGINLSLFTKYFDSECLFQVCVG
jgi:hypothetical protein